MEAKIVVLPGDGIGPEVTSAALAVLTAVSQKFGHTFETEEKLMGGCAIDATGTALPEETKAACLAADAVLLGAVGGPKWDDPTAAVRPEQGLLGIRQRRPLTRRAARDEAVNASFHLPFDEASQGFFR